MKKCFSALLCLCIILSLCACAPKEPVKIKGNGQINIDSIIQDGMSVEDSRRLEDFERVQNKYMQACELYETILDLDARITTGVEDPLQIAPEYEVVLGNIDELVVHIMALKLKDTQCNQLCSMLETWVSIDTAIYCQKMCAAISRNDVQAAADALVMRNAMYNDFTVLTENIILVGSKVQGANISDIEEWYAEHNITAGGNNNELPDTSGGQRLDPEIPQNYIPVPGENELYMVIDDDGKIEKYRQREQLEDGSWMWNDVNPDIPASYEPVKGFEDIYKVTDRNGNATYLKYIRNQDDTYCWEDAEALPNTPGSTEPSDPDTNSSDNDAQDSYAQTEKVTSTEVKGDWVITYETKITRVYTAQGILISTQKDGPTEVGRRKLADSDPSIPDTSKIAATLREEHTRVSTGLIYERDLAEDVISILNIKRADTGLVAMRLESESSGQMLADIRAADMAIYNHSDYDSPLYGTVTDMCKRFSVKHEGTSEAIWRTTATKTAEDIASRLQIMYGDLVGAETHDSIGLSIVQENGYYYIDFVVIP